jgi:hypothetical protein
VFTGLPEEQALVQEIQAIELISSTFSGNYNFNIQARVLIGVNSTSAGSGTSILLAREDSFTGQISSGQYQSNLQSSASYTLQPTIGVNTLQALESSPNNTSGTITYFGTEINMLLSAAYRG